MAIYMTTVIRFAAQCPWCQEQAPEPWLIIHQPGCPAGEEVESDENQEDEEEEVT